MSVEQVRRFNRAVSRRIGALSDSYLSRGRPLGEARILFELGEEGLDLAQLRARTGLDPGYLSRLLRSLERQGLAELREDGADRRRRHVAPTPRGREEQAAYDRLSDDLARSMLASLREEDQARLVEAMAVVERLLRAGDVELRIEPPGSRDARACRTAYFEELARRFEEGFDPAAGKTAQDEGMRPPLGAFIVARLDGEPVGCGGFTRLDRETAEFKRMWTSPRARGLGIARRVLCELERLAAGAGLRVIRLDTNRALVEAQAFYRREGYREIPRYNDNPYAHLWFEKRLG
ncbi:helix-turn-helix domain-containing GNAT family N-acetyltransferase [Enterovirga sp.]|uniref:helix-turn-helix domain-containing GNAT family N-acetyltransferase n=1 Tax=Enterovirga sp. TaxID=2026350 RepID=UPI002C892B52|nr:helix-turn-helix domain-containing GNAT family N-acetyltransferase [Enterovirga sp.]HMO29919.1 helix-turn-helix domain-containing GNAT family N-acetyltransferase [Enterovirga sp.]